MSPRPKNPSTDLMSLLWPRQMSIQTAARYLDASVWAMEEMFRSGEIVAYKPRGSGNNAAWAVDRLELDRHVDRRHAEAAALAPSTRHSTRIDESVFAEGVAQHFKEGLGRLGAWHE